MDKKENIYLNRVLYSVKEAAVTLGISRDTVYRLVKTGEIPALELGGIRIRSEALESFLHKKEKEYSKQLRKQDYETVFN